ncbi:MAG: hypothetical protein R6W70_07375 [bacterium]
MAVDHLKKANLTYDDYKKCSVDNLIERLDKNPTGQKSDTLVTLGYILGKYTSIFKETNEKFEKNSQTQSKIMWFQVVVMIAQIIIAVVAIIKS